MFFNLIIILNLALNTNQSINHYFIDQTEESEVKSEVLHIVCGCYIYTPCAWLLSMYYILNGCLAMHFILIDFVVKVNFACKWGFYGINMIKQGGIMFCDLFLFELLTLVLIDSNRNWIRKVHTRNRCKGNKIILIGYTL